MHVRVPKAGRRNAPASVDRATSRHCVFGGAGLHLDEVPVSNADGRVWDYLLVGRGIELRVRDQPLDASIEAALPRRVGGMIPAPLHQDRQNPEQQLGAESALPGFPRLGRHKQKGTIDFGGEGVSLVSNRF